jgi:hypothetical protein
MTLLAVAEKAKQQSALSFAVTLSVVLTYSFSNTWL